MAAPAVSLHDISICRPVSGSLIAEMFSASYRGVANGVFSWGVYYGYGLAFVFGIYITSADVLGYGWRSPYVLAGLPGLLLALLTLTTFPDPRQQDAGQAENKKLNLVVDGVAYLRKLLRNFCSPTMWLLLLAGKDLPTCGPTCGPLLTPLIVIQHFSATLLATAGLTTPETSSSSTTRTLISGPGPSAPPSLEDPSESSLEDSSLTDSSSIWAFPPDCGSSLSAPFSPLPSPWAPFTSLPRELSVRFLPTSHPPPPPPHLPLPGCLILYYFLAETWFAVLFTVIVEIVEPEVGSRWSVVREQIWYLRWGQPALLSFSSWWTWWVAIFRWSSLHSENTSRTTGSLYISSGRDFSQSRLSYFSWLHFLSGWGRGKNGQKSNKIRGNYDPVKLSTLRKVSLILLLNKTKAI